MPCMICGAESMLCSGANGEILVDLCADHVEVIRDVTPLELPDKCANCFLAGRCCQTRQG